MVSTYLNEAGGGGGGGGGVVGTEGVQLPPQKIMITIKNLPASESERLYTSIDNLRCSPLSLSLLQSPALEPSPFDSRGRDG